MLWNPDYGYEKVTQVNRPLWPLGGTYQYSLYYTGGAYKDGPENIFLQKWTGQNMTGDNFVGVLGELKLENLTYFYTGGGVDDLL